MIFRFTIIYFFIYIITFGESYIRCANIAKKGLYLLDKNKVLLVKNVITTIEYQKYNKDHKSEIYDFRNEIEGEFYFIDSDSKINFDSCYDDVNGGPSYLFQSKLRVKYFLNGSNINEIESDKSSEFLEMLRSNGVSIPGIKNGKDYNSLFKGTFSSFSYNNTDKHENDTSAYSSNQSQSSILSDESTSKTTQLLTEDTSLDAELSSPSPRKRARLDHGQSESPVGTFTDKETSTGRQTNDKKLVKKEPNHIVDDYREVEEQMDLGVTEQSIGNNYPSSHKSNDSNEGASSMTDKQSQTKKRKLMSRAVERDNSTRTLSNDSEIATLSSGSEAVGSNSLIPEFGEKIVSNGEVRINNISLKIKGKIEEIINNLNENQSIKLTPESIRINRKYGQVIIKVYKRVLGNKLYTITLFHIDGKKELFICKKIGLEVDRATLRIKLKYGLILGIDGDAEKIRLPGITVAIERYDLSLSTSPHPEEKLEEIKK